MKSLILIILVMLGTNAHSQFHTLMSRSEMGIMVGGTYYIGDLNQFGHFKNTHLALGLVYRYNINSRVSFRANFLYGRVSADDATSKELVYQQRNLNFESDIFELAAGLEFNYFPFQLGHDRYKGTAYILAEIGVFRMDPTTNFNGEDVQLRTLGTEGQGTSLSSKQYYSMTQICLPVGVGVKLSLGQRVGLNLEFGVRKTFTDYLDDVHADSYADPDVLVVESGPLAAQLSNRSGNRYGKRGNASTKDWYFFSGMMITIRLGKPEICW